MSEEEEEQSLGGLFSGNGSIDTAAISLHELYMSYVRAGFSDDQAFQITMLNLKLAYSTGGNGNG